MPGVILLSNKSCCPTFIIADGGQYLGALGAIVTDGHIVQRLTGLVWLGTDQVFEDNHQCCIAQVFDSLCGALRQLDEFYDELDKQDPESSDGNPHS